MIKKIVSTFFSKEVLNYNNVQIWLIFVMAVLIGHFMLTWIQKRPRNLPPGPIGLPIVGYLPFLGKEPHKTLKKLAKKYGNIFGLYMGPKYTIIINDYKVMKEALTNPGSLDRSTNIFEHLLTPGFLTSNGEEWVEQRRFSIETARDLGLGKGSWEFLIFEEIGNFLKEIEAYGGAPTVINHDLTVSLSNNILALVIGRRLNKQTEKDKIQLCIDYTEVALTYTGPSQAATLMPMLRKYLQFFKIAGYDKAHKIVKKFCQFVIEEIARHKTSQQFKNIPDFINTYLEKISNVASNEETTGRKHYFSEEHLQGSMATLFLGASDTLDSSLGWGLKIMAKHQDVQEKVYKEIIDVLGEDGQATFRDKHLIPYTFAVLMELQRFSSIVPLSTTRLANRDFEVNGYTIPKGAEIVTNLWALHNDPNYWDEPEKFKPERFLTKTGKEILKHIPSFVPFSIGRRNCPGETFAYMEILAYLSEIVRSFHIIPPPGVELDFEEINGLVSRLKPQALCFIKRS